MLEKRGFVGRQTILFWEKNVYGLMTKVDLLFYFGQFIDKIVYFG